MLDLRNCFHNFTVLNICSCSQCCLNYLAYIAYFLKMLGSHWTILNVQGCNKPFLENVSAVIELRLSFAYPQCSRCHKPFLGMFRLSLSFVNVQRLPISCLQIAQAVIDLFSECSGCHWRIPNQDVITLFSKCSGCHWPLLHVQDVNVLSSNCASCH